MDIAIATEDRDIAAVRALCREALDWELATFPEHRAKILSHHAAPAWEAFLQTLPERYVAPDAAMFLARLQGRPVGACLCAIDPTGRLKLRRLFVSEAARGHGLGRRLVEICLAHGRERGAHTAVLTTADFLTHAIALYRALGFVDGEPLEPVPSEVRGVVRFMERRI